jgi:secondary thiamine-phosphate synthase enzyme
LKVKTFLLTVKTSTKFQSIDITDEVQNKIDVKEGVAYIFSKHTTCTVIVNEAEKGLMSDYLDWANKLVPPEGDFKHNVMDNNGHAHVISSIIGNSRVVPISEGKLDLGTWQRIIFLEFDGPRTRTLAIKVFGE